MNQNSPPPPPNSAAASGTGTTSSAHAKPTTIPRRMHSNSASASLGVASKDSVTDPKRTTKTASKLVVFPPASPPLPPVSQPFHPAIPASHYPLSPSDGLGHNPQQQFHHPTSAQPDFSHSEFHQHNPQQPPQLQPFSSTGPRTEAERLSKEFRIHLPRVTCYCAADSYDIKAICSFLKTKHGVVGREYDECLYVSYEHRVAGGVNAYAQLMMKHTARVIMETAVQSHNSTLSALNLAEGLGSTGNFEKMEQPVIPASAVNGPAMEGVRSRSRAPSPMPPPPMDRTAEANRANFPDTHGTFANFPDTHLTDPHLSAPTSTADGIALDPEDLATVPENGISETTTTTARATTPPGVEDGLRENGIRRRVSAAMGLRSNTTSPMRPISPSSGNLVNTELRKSHTNLRAAAIDAVNSNASANAAGTPATSPKPVVADYKWMGRNEVFLFDFGVIVLWNFTVEEEQLYLSILKPFATNPRHSVDAEIEDFHFQYDFTKPNQPRIYNDMITLKSGNPMIKLTISHGIAQSAKLAYFENVMEQEIQQTSVLPKMMAKYGEVKLTRDDVVKVVGRLFRLRMNVNLVSNVLDTPEIFWSEPELQGLYNAIRGYLEISQRVKLLNTRTGVISDLLDMLSDHLHGSQHTMMTRIVIYLIVITCIVAGAEVYVKTLLEKAVK